MLMVMGSGRTQRSHHDHDGRSSACILRLEAAAVLMSKADGVLLVIFTKVLLINHLGAMGSSYRPFCTLCVVRGPKESVRLWFV